MAEVASHPEFTVTVTFHDGFTSTRDLLDHRELVRYVSEGVAMWNLQTLVVRHNPPHPES